MEELIKRILDGDSAAFDELYRATNKSVYFHAKIILKNEEDAADAVQETYIQAFRKLGSLNDPAAVKSWLNTIVCNICYNKLAKNKREYTDSLDDEEVYFEPEAPQSERPDEQLDRQSTADIVSGMIDKLPDLQRTTIMMFYYDELSVKQIAEIMDCSENTVKSRLNYARKSIKEQVLEEEKRGVKLYSVSPIVIMLALKNMEAGSGLSSAAAEQIAQAIAGKLGYAVGAAASSSASGAAVSSTVGKTAKLTAKLGTRVGAKAVAIAAAVVTAAGIGVGIAHKNREPEIVLSYCEENGHTWIAATCSAPETCLVCGETQGTVLDHRFTAATCTEPEICELCGATGAPAVGHTFSEADYWTPATCTVCGVTEGEPLVPLFEQYDIPMAELNVPYRINTYEYSYPSTESIPTTVLVTFSDLNKFESDEQHEAKEGYEWISVTETLVPESEKGGMKWCGFYGNYYSGEFSDLTWSDDGLGRIGTFMLDWQGKEYQSEIYEDVIDISAFSRSFTVQVPNGYDGVVIGIYNSEISKSEIFDNYSPDDFVFFRLVP